MSNCDRDVDYFHACHFDTDSIAPISQEYDCLHDLANSEVWPHCAEGMGVDGDELLQEFIDEGRVGRTEGGKYILLQTTEQVRDRVYETFKNIRGL